MLVKNRRRAQTMCCLFSCLALQISKHSLHNTNTLAVCKVYSFIDVVCNRHETDEVHPNTVGRRPLTVHTSHSTGSPDLKPTVWMKHQNGAVGGPSEWGRRPLEADQGPLFLDGPEFVSLIRVRVGLRIQPALGVNGSRVHTTDWLATLPWCRDSKDTQCEYEMLDHWTAFNMLKFSSEFPQRHIIHIDNDDDLHTQASNTWGVNWCWRQFLPCQWSMTSDLHLEGQGYIQLCCFCVKPSIRFPPPFWGEGKTIFTHIK